MPHQHECDNCGEPCDGEHRDSRYDEPICKSCHEEESWDCGPSDYEERMTERRQMGLCNF